MPAASRNTGLGYGCTIGSNVAPDGRISRWPTGSAATPPPPPDPEPVAPPPAWVAARAGPSGEEPAHPRHGHHRQVAALERLAEDGLDTGAGADTVGQILQEALGRAALSGVTGILCGLRLLALHGLPPSEAKAQPTSEDQAFMYEIPEEMRPHVLEKRRLLDQRRPDAWSGVAPPGAAAT